MSKVGWLILAIGIGLVVWVGLILRQREIARQSAMPVMSKERLTPAERRGIQELNEFVESFHAKVQEQVREEDLRSARVFFGWDSALASVVKGCGDAGYPPTTSNLSRRRIAECDAVFKRLHERKAQFAAEEAKKDAAFDKAHPVK